MVFAPFRASLHRSEARSVCAFTPAGAVAGPDPSVVCEGAMTSVPCQVSRRGLLVALAGKEVVLDIYADGSKSDDLDIKCGVSLPDLGSLNLDVNFGGGVLV